MSPTETATRIDEITRDLAGVLNARVLNGHMTVLADEDLLALGAGVERVGRLIDAARVAFAGEVAARSRPELGDEGLSRSENFATPAGLLSAVTATSAKEARARLDLGLRLHGAVLLGGGLGPEPYPAVSEALAGGVLAVEAAAVIVRHCAALTERGLTERDLGGEVVAEAEQTLVEQTVRLRLTPDETDRLGIRVREFLDPDGAEPRAERQHRLRSLTFARTADGMIRISGLLTPEQGGILISSIQALQSPRVLPRFVDHAGESESASESASESDRDGDRDKNLDEDNAVAAAMVSSDTRTTPQKNADTLIELITRAAAAPEMPNLSGSATTLNVHTNLADIEAGRGVGYIDGIDEPVPASTIEQLRCHSATVTTVFGDAGEILHHGKARRLFSPAQNRALAARDGGCVWNGCDRPPPWCETHHVTDWKAAGYAPGRTDIDNGVLLCHFHHSHLHRAKWKLTMIRGVPHMVPPRWIDITQTPIPTSRRRTLRTA